MSLWYWRDGTPADDMKAIEEKLGDHDYKVVEQTTLPNGLWVSTVWLGLDHSFCREGPPLIFETMVFESKENLHDLDCERYPTEAEAIEGHWRMVAKHR